MPSKRLNITKRKDGRYRLQKSFDGKMKSFYGRTKFEVMAKYNQFVAERNNNTQTGMLSECIYEWMLNFKFGKIKGSSYDRLETVYECHLKNDPIGKMQVHDIKSLDLQQYIDRKAFPENKNQLLSLSSVKKIKELLSGYFKFAYEQNIISFNPMLAVKIPMQDNFEKKTKEVEEIPQKILDALYSDCNMSRRYNTALVILLNTGLRIGELIALNWDDVSIDEKIMRVNKTISVNKKRDGTRDLQGRERKEGSTKTYCGNRIIPINQRVIDCLNMIDEENKRLKISTEKVVSTRNGTMASARNIQRAFDAWLYANGFQHYNLHALRHTFGSILIRKGVDIKVVSELLGHSKVQTTYNIYIHVLQEQKVKAINLMDDVI